MFKLGMVGAGIIGNAHSAAIKTNQDCVLVAVADIDKKKAEEIANVYGAAAFSDYKQMAEETELDAVILNLPHYLHCPAAVYFLNLGVNVLVEKPMANTVAECDEMITAAKKTGKKLAIGHIQRHYSAIREVKKIIESEKFGKLCMITETRNTNYLKNRPEWFLKKELSGAGILMNYGAHSLDRILYATGCSIENVHAITSNPLSNDDVEINAQVLLKLSGGASASITYCGCHVPGEYETSYYFTDGVVKITKGDQLCIYENGEFVNYGGTAPLIEEQLKEFVKYLRGEENEMPTPEYGREIIKVIEKIV